MERTTCYLTCTTRALASKAVRAVLIKQFGDDFPGVQTGVEALEVHDGQSDGVYQSPSDPSQTVIFEREAGYGVFDPIMNELRDNNIAYELYDRGDDIETHAFITYWSPGMPAPLEVSLGIEGEPQISAIAVLQSLRHAALNIGQVDELIDHMVNRHHELSYVLETA